MPSSSPIAAVAVFTSATRDGVGGRARRGVDAAEPRGEALELEAPRRPIAMADVAW